MVTAVLVRLQHEALRQAALSCNRQRLQGVSRWWLQWQVPERSSPAGPAGGGNSGGWGTGQSWLRKG